MSAELERLSDARAPWEKWGPYLSERQWGTVREDYSPGGDAWGYFSHDQARSRAYRWGEDGLAGISDDKQLLCFALALWNGRDPILKERLFGLTNNEGNHGEDCKEYYFYLDSTPTHSYMKYLYKYPQSPYPYNDLVQTNRWRSRHDFESELIDTGVFDQDRYFDVFVEYAKASPEDILIAITAHNRGPDSAVLHVLPTVWFRNTWSWGDGAEKPILKKDGRAISAHHPILGDRYVAFEGEPLLLFTENETNTERLFGIPNRTPYVKDGIQNAVVEGNPASVNPQQVGTKAAAHYVLEIPPGTSRTIRVRLSDAPPRLTDAFDEILRARKQEADEFFDQLTPASADEDERRILRQSLAGMLWSKQFYIYDVDQWLKEHGIDRTYTRGRDIRNREWFHMVNEDIISMPDKWEYPWYAAWDLAFHAIALSIVDPDFAREQLGLMLRERYLHPNGQIPAYEWNFGDVNPPVHAWATLFNYRFKSEQRGEEDIRFLKAMFQKLLMNFTWWVNRKDREGKNVFEGGFLGLDNIGVFDRSRPLPMGGTLEQADGTAWMALFCQNMLEMAIEVALHDPVYEEVACKFYEHFLWIASSMNRMGEQQDEMWDEEDGFFYDLVRLPDGSATRIKVRSMVGLLPLCASTVFPAEAIEKLPTFMERARWFTRNHPELTANINSPGKPGVNGRLLLSLLNETNLRRVLSRMLDEKEFLSDYGIRSLSRHHAEHPYAFRLGNEEFRIAYEPAESTTGMFGGNSNWRGPIWLPTNALILRALINMYRYYGDDFLIECPTGSGHLMNLFQVARDIGNRLKRIFTRDTNGRRPVYGGSRKFQTDPHWKDHLLFYEYFHGDNGAGLGASHQTGWTGLVGLIIWLFGSVTQDRILSDSFVPPTPLAEAARRRST